MNPPPFYLGPCQHKHMGHVEVRSLRSPTYCTSSYQTSEDESPSTCFDPYFDMGDTPRFDASSNESSQPRLYDFKSPVHQTMTPFLHSKKTVPKKSPHRVIEDSQASPTITVIGFKAPYRPPAQDLDYVHYQRHYYRAMGF